MTAISEFFLSLYLYSALLHNILAIDYNKNLMNFISKFYTYFKYQRNNNYWWKAEQATRQLEEFQSFYVGMSLTDFVLEILTLIESVQIF